MSILEARGAPINGIQFEARSGDLSAVAGASILASLSKLNEDLSLTPPPAKTGKNMEQNTDVSSLPSGNGNDIPDIEMKHDSDNYEPAGIFSTKKTGLASSTTIDEDPKLDTNVNADVGKVTAATCKLRPLLHMLAGSYPEFDLSGSIAKVLEERKELRELLKDVDTPTLLASTRQQAFKDSLQQRILNAENIDVSFESFPYYLRYKYLLLFIKFFLLDILFYATLTIVWSRLDVSYNHLVFLLLRCWVGWLVVTSFKLR